MASLSADPALFRRARFRQLQRLSNGDATALTILRTRRFLADFPDHGAAWLLLGISLVELARYEEAEAALRRSLALAPRRGRRIPLGQLGHLFAFRGQRKRAAYWFRSGIKADRKVAWCRIFLGELLASSGRLREAEEEFRRATRCREGRIDEAYFHLGLVLRGQERFEAAAECLREAIQLRPRYRQARSALRDVERCARLLARSSSGSSPSSAASSLVGDPALRRKRRLRQLQRLSDSDAPALTVLHARVFLQELPRHGPAWLYLGKALVELSRHDEAESAIRKALAMFPRTKTSLVLGEMGHLFRARGDFRRAEQCYRRGIAARRSHASCRIYLGGVLAKSGRLREAEAVHRAATRCREGCIDEAYLNLAMVLRAQERFETAAGCLREAIRLDPQYRVARAVLRDVERCRREQARTSRKGLSSCSTGAGRSQEGGE